MHELKRGMKFRLILLYFLLLPAGVFAQDAEPTLPPAQTQAPAPVEPSAPYGNQLQRLAEVLGSIHYLRTLCGANEGSKWRDIMNGLIESEKPGPKRKERLISRFNRGYRAFDESYGSCTSSAIFASERYMKEGILLTEQITGRYGR